MTPSENLRFKIAYIEAKEEIIKCREKVAKYSFEHNIHLARIWRVNLSEAEHTLKDFEFFLLIFHDLKEFCYEESVVLNG